MSHQSSHICHTTARTGIYNGLGSAAAGAACHVLHIYVTRVMSLPYLYTKNGTGVYTDLGSAAAGSVRHVPDTYQKHTSHVPNIYVTRNLAQVCTTD